MHACGYDNKNRDVAYVAQMRGGASCPPCWLAKTMLEVFKAWLFLVLFGVRIEPRRGHKKVL